MIHGRAIPRQLFPFGDCFTGLIPMKNQHSQPSFARCVLHLRSIHRNPSGFRFYVCGIAREFANPCGEIILAGIVLLLFCFGVNLFF